MTGAERITLGSVPVDAVTWPEALARIDALVSDGRGGAVFTPNVDHVVQADDNPRLRDAYARVSLSLADGMPLLWASRLLGTPLPAKISGSDFTPVVLERAAERGWRVYLLGGADGVATSARDALQRRLPSLQVVGVEAPAIDPEAPLAAYRDIITRIRSAAPALVFVALGAPKQEVWIDRVRDDLRPAVLLGIGASLDFVAGVAPRAPRWMADVGLEWLFRLKHEPRRLWRRYLVRDPRFLVILGRSLAGYRSPRDGRPARPGGPRGPRWGV